MDIRILLRMVHNFAVVSTLLAAWMIIKQGNTPAIKAILHGMEYLMIIITVISVVTIIFGNGYYGYIIFKFDINIIIPYFVMNLLLRYTKKYNKK